MLYSSIDNKKIKELKKLNDKKYRDLNNMFLVETKHLVEEAYKNGYLKELIVLDSYEYKLDVETSYVTEKVMKYITNLDSISKVIGVCSKLKSKEIGNRIVVLDNIQDPGNLGTIIRSCVAFNIDTLILSNDTVDLYNSKVIRASEGMMFKLNIIACNIEEKIKELKDNGYKIYGTKVNGGNSLKSIEKSSRFAIIMGNEGNGVKNSINDLSDEFLYIDMNKDCESLNVAVATSIILYVFNK